jgi:formate dehydrogenase maturation protein FdhE
VAPRDHQALAARARALADRFPASRDVLLFYASAIALDWPALGEFAASAGPPPMAAAARQFDPSLAATHLDDASPLSFFARLAIRARGQYPCAEPREGSCPRCGRPPQAGVLRPEGDGTAFSLACSLCPNEWSFPRGRCPGCAAGSLAYYSAQGIDHIQVMACESCRRYLHLVSVASDPDAIPEVDELAALPLDVWALERGFTKLHPNLAGI